MKTKLVGFALFVLTLTAIAVYPSIQSKPVPIDTGTDIGQHLTSKPIIDVVFVLDTTSSMTGLIETAKEKIWSIATTMTSAQQTPDIRIGLVAFRDRGDEYVTKVVDLSDDIDSVYAALMEFQASGGGDGPESVNKALYDAVHGISWSQDPGAYQVIFLVGDAPPHMDYQDEVQYPEIMADAVTKGIVINTIQCGDVEKTQSTWGKIAHLGEGRFFQVEQAGSAVAYASPFDKKIAELSAKLDDTRLYYGSREEKAKMQRKVEATDKLNKGASISTRARRGAFNSSAGGKKNLLGDNELVSAIASGEVELKDLNKDVLPATLQMMSVVEQRAAIAKKAKKRNELQRQIQDLAQKRGDYISEKVKADGGGADSLDHQVYDAVREQASKTGLTYEEGPEY